MNRRHFLVKLAALPLMWGLPGRPGGGRTLGVDLGSFHAEMEQDYGSFLRRIVDIGYREIELDTHYGASRFQFRYLLKRLGLTPVAGGAPLQELIARPDEWIEQASFMGKSFLTCADVFPADLPHPEEVRRTADRLNELGRLCRSAGLRLAVRHTATEFRPVDGLCIMDLLLRETDPADVGIALDTYWAVRGGGDPLDFIARYPGRFPMAYLRDVEGAARLGVAVPGEGTIAFDELFAVADRAGMRCFIVQPEGLPRPLDAITQAHDFLTRDST